MSNKLIYAIILWLLATFWTAVGAIVWYWVHK